MSKQESASTLPTSTIVQIINAMFMLMLAVLDLINLKSQVRGGWGHLLEGEPGLGLDPERLENILEIEVQLLGDFLYFLITIKSPFAHKTYPWH